MVWPSLWLLSCQGRYWSSGRFIDRCSMTLSGMPSAPSDFARSNSVGLLSFSWVVMALQRSFRQ
jgi:hypothetical protein